MYNSDNTLVNLQEAAEIIGVHPETLRRWDRDGTLSAIKIGTRGDRKYKISEINMLTGGLTLTKKERWTLVNQYKILELLSKDKYEAEYCVWIREVLENGYELHYPEITQEIYDDTLSNTACKEVLDILDMFRAIKRSYNKLEDKSGISEYKIHFCGFDGNDRTELKYLSYSRFFCTSREIKFKELTKEKNFSFNSHMPKLNMYRSMLTEWKNSKNKGDLTKKDLLRITKTK